MKKNIIIKGIFLIIFIGGICFYGGMKYSEQNKKTPDFKNLQNTEGFSKTRPAEDSRGGIINGEIIDQDETKIIIKSADQGSKIIFLSEKTIISKTVEANLNDLQIGKKIMISGKTNEDGSITAESIQLASDLIKQPTAPNN
jgi:type V secretory pathway adhesin AidA